MIIQKANPLNSGDLFSLIQTHKQKNGDYSAQLANNIIQPSRISTGIFALDFALLGGIPLNRTTSIIGEKHSGKSMLSNKLIANVQRQFPDQVPAIVDLEGSFEPNWAELLGVDLSRLNIISANSGEHASDIIDMLLQAKECSLVIVDSVAAMTPLKELDGSAEDKLQMGLHAKLMNATCKKTNNSMIQASMKRHKVALVFINQIRMSMSAYGDPRVTPGGKAVGFYSSIEFFIKNKEKIERNDIGFEVPIENEHSFQIVKNKLNGGIRAGEFLLVREDRSSENLFVGDVDDAKTMISVAKKFNIYSGGASKWRLELNGKVREYRKAEEFAKDLNIDKDYKAELRLALLREQAKYLKMSNDFIGRLK